MEDSSKDKELIISAGIVLRSKGKYLLARPTGNTGTTKGWGIPKGKVDSGETLLEAAMREFREETNLDLSQHPIITVSAEPITSVSLKIGKKQKKKVYAFFADDPAGTVANFPFECVSFTPSGKPELDAYEWVDLDEAIQRSIKSQKPIFQHIKENL